MNRRDAVLALLALLSAPLAARAQAPQHARVVDRKEDEMRDVEALRATIDGIYVLEAWHTDAGVFRPPQVEGRFILLNGAVITVLHNRIQESNQTTLASYGSYVLNLTEFSYRYDKPSVFTQTSSGIAVSHKAPWEGMRSFAVSRDGETVRLRSATEEEFLFSRDGVKYSQSGKLLRVWRRIPSTQ
jgi:hypothetical protein